MSKLVPFDSISKVPATLSQMFGGTAKDLVGNAPSGGFPVVSIKGKVFHIQRGDERILVTKPGEDDPAASLEVVIVRANPNRSKVFYAEGYSEGERSKPTCYSNDGVEPAADAQEKQAKKCAACAHNQWGSRVTDGGGKAKACSDSRRIAIATPDAPADPMLLRIPAASMKALEDYGKQLAARGIPPQAVITKVGFDYSVAWPALTFKPVAIIGEMETLQQIKISSESELTAQIVGLAPTPSAATESEVKETAAAATPTPTPTPAPAPKAAAPKPAPKPAAADPLEAAMAAAESTTRKATVEVGTKGGSLEGQIASMIGDLDFDDN